MMCYKKYLSTGLVLVLIVMNNYSASQGRLLYRYVNEKGVKVLTYSIPAQYISNGYEVIDSSGRLVKVVPPELSSEAKAKAELEQAEIEQLENWDRQLLKRYSRIGDIEAAKKRKLAEISANINILRGNIVNLNNEMDELQSKAAAIERSGQPIPDTILGNISAVKEELTVMTNRIGLRQQEYQTEADKFDKDMARFRIIKPENTVEKEGNRQIDK